MLSTSWSRLLVRLNRWSNRLSSLSDSLIFRCLRYWEWWGWFQHHGEIRTRADDIFFSMLRLFWFWRRTLSFKESRIPSSSLLLRLFCWFFIVYRSLSVEGWVWIWFQELWDFFLPWLGLTVRASFARTASRGWLTWCPGLGNPLFLFSEGLVSRFLLNRWKCLHFGDVSRCGQLQHWKAHRSWFFYYLLSSWGTRIAQKEGPWVSKSFPSQAVLAAKLFPFLSVPSLEWIGTESHWRSSWGFPGYHWGNLYTSQKISSMSPRFLGRV